MQRTPNFSKAVISAIGAMLLLLGPGLPARAQVELVRDGKARAVVVIAARPSQVATYAAQELVEHVAKATGQTLPIVSEPNVPPGYACHVYIGVTDAARRQGIEPEKMAIEDFLLRTVGSDLYIVGNELSPDQKVQYEIDMPQREPRNPLSTHNVYSGTLFGVYEVLERYLGVRWLWPGELGTYVPRTQSVVIPALDETVKPQLLYRDLGGWDLEQMRLSGSYYGRRITPTWSTGVIASEQILRDLIFANADAGYTYGRAMDVYNRRHRRVTPEQDPPRIPRTTQQTAGIGDWWKLYGKDHPEWFAMRADGGRGRLVPRAGSYVGLCVSNPELQRFIVNSAWDGGPVLNLGEADVSGDGMCQCPVCQSWDGPQPTNYPKIVSEFYDPRVMSNRYAQWWKIEYDMAVKRNPNVRVTTSLYFNTLPAPTNGIKFNDHVQGEFVRYGNWAGWYPMSKVEDKWFKDQWDGWAKTGMMMFDRSNYLLSNWVTPNVAMHQEGDFLKFAIARHMTGISLESFTFSWANQGPEAYMHYRLIEHPDLKVKDILNEYYSAFGPAAKDVEAYFDYWENYARTRPALFDMSSGDHGAELQSLRRPRGHCMAYPPEAYVPAAAILDRALAAAQTDPDPQYAARVRFLQAGIQHALLTERVFNDLDYDGPLATHGTVPTDPAKLKVAREAMRDLIAFRHDPKNLFVSDYISDGMIEKYYITNLTALLPEDGK